MPETTPAPFYFLFIKPPVFEKSPWLFRKLRSLSSKSHEKVPKPPIIWQNWVCFWNDLNGLVFSENDFGKSLSHDFISEQGDIVSEQRDKKRNELYL